jgi:arsenite methyltransferase
MRFSSPAPNSTIRDRRSEEIGADRECLPACRRASWRSGQIIATGITIPALEARNNVDLDWWGPMTTRSIVQQLSRPSGFLGKIIANLMNRKNAKMNLFAIRQLKIAPSDRVLEIGFGGAATLPNLIENAGFVAGVDRSPDVVRHAKLRFSQAVTAGRAAFHEGSVEALPFGTSSFEKAFTVNTVYSWKSLHEGLREIHRVLAPGGRLAVGFLPKEWMDRMNMPGDIFRSRATGGVVTAIQEAGFSVIHIRKPEPTTAWVVVVASR